MRWRWTWSGLSSVRNVFGPQTLQQREIRSRVLVLADEINHGQLLLVLWSEVVQQKLVCLPREVLRDAPVHVVREKKHPGLFIQACNGETSLRRL